MLAIGLIEEKRRFGDHVHLDSMVVGIG
jgi:hypothetical protein